MSNESEPRPIAVDTSLLFPMIRSACHSAECKLIDGKRCFVVTDSVYFRIMSFLFASGRDFRFDPRLASMGYDNFQIQLNATDSHDYWLATKSPSLLDELWSNKGPKETPK